MPSRYPRRLEIELGTVEESDFVDMCSIFMHAFPTDNPKLSQVMYAGRYPETALSNALEGHLHSEYSKFVIASDVSEEFDEDMVYGWISVGIVTRDSDLYSFAASDLSVYLSFQMLATEVRDKGDDPRQLHANDPRARLASELRERSADGQLRSVDDPHMVVNSLSLWPDAHKDSIWEMALKLLKWAVTYAERHDWQIWTQIPADQAPFFRNAGFTEVGAFTLDLNNYSFSNNADCGTQQWVQMVYSDTSERRARSTSPKGGRSRRRRLSV